MLDLRMEQVSAIMQDDLILLALPLFLVAVLVEYIYSARRNIAWYERHDFLGSMGVMVITAVVDILPKLVGVAAMFVLYDISPLKGTFGRQWWSWLLLFLLEGQSRWCC